MTKAIIVWQCPDCKDIIISNNWTTHNMDMCKCNKSGCDMEEHYVRWIGHDALTLKAKRYFLDELLRKE